MDDNHTNSAPAQQPAQDHNSGGTQENKHNEHKSQSRTLMSIVSYIPFLFLVPMLTGDKSDSFVDYHMKQGIVFTILVVVVQILFPMLFFALFFLFWLMPLIQLLFVVLFVIGVMHAVKGEQKPLPLIGHFANSFNI